MAPPQDPSSDDPFKKPESPAKSPPDFEKVVDELRNVLSALNKPKSEEIIPEPLPEEDLLRSPQSLTPPNALESEKLGEAAFRQAAEPSSLENPSDAEFWNGNVLGWPHSFSEGLKEPEPPKAEPEAPGFE